MDRPGMIQPFVPSIATEGEYSFLFVDGEFSHALVKRAKHGRLSHPGSLWRPLAAHRSRARTTNARPTPCSKHSMSRRFMPASTWCADTTAACC